MKFLKLSCPACGGVLQALESKEKHFECDHCRNVYVLDDSGKVRVVSTPTQPEDRRAVKPKPKNPLLEPWYLSLPFFVILILACGLFVIISTKFSANTTSVDTLGRYVIPASGDDRIFRCPDESHPVAEFGFVHEPPVLIVYPTIEGQNHWEIPADIAERIAQKPKSGIGLILGTYIWVHCDTPDKLPEYYVQGFFATIYPPKDGQEVIFKK